MRAIPARSRRGAAAGLAVLAVAAVLIPAHGMFKRPNEAPVERLIKNVAAYVQEHPKDAQGFYVLARLNSLAFILKSDTVSFYGKEDAKDAKELPNFGHGMQGWGSAKGPSPSAEALRAHLKAAIENFGKAIELEPKNGLFRLGLAYTLESGAAAADGAPPGLAKAGEKPTEAELAKCEELAKKLGNDNLEVREDAQQQLQAMGAKAATVIVKCAKDPDAEVSARAKRLLGALWSEPAIAEYLEAHRLSIEEDLKITHQPIRGLASLAGYEAGECYARLAKARGMTDVEKKQVEQIEENLKALKGKPHGPITPIVFPLDGRRPLEELLADGRAVRFDLDGDEAVEEWPWVKPDTGILVWDPSGSGKIMSGRQLFGSVTWWMFWTDGYRALDALDDDRDGALTGDELRGLAVWRDANGNGVSDPGEVVPVEDLGIVRIDVRATHRAGGCPANENGIRMRDGRVLPTYDWIAEPKGN